MLTNCLSENICKSTPKGGSSAIFTVHLIQTDPSRLKSHVMAHIYYFNFYYLHVTGAFGDHGPASESDIVPKTKPDTLMHYKPGHF